MNKQELKNVLDNLNTGDQITVAFLQEREHDDSPECVKRGVFEVLRVKNGRGKGGSRLVEMKNVTSGHRLTTGTPDSDNILHIIDANGSMHGFENASEIPPTFEADGSKASELKPVFTNLLDASGQYQVRVDSTHEPFNGTFKVVEGKQKRGRYGQVVLVLQADDNSEPFELWSYKHSGVITNFEIL